MCEESIYIDVSASNSVYHYIVSLTLVIIVVWSSVGSPGYERWLSQHLQVHRVCIVLGCGVIFFPYIGSSVKLRKNETGESEKCFYCGKLFSVWKGKGCRERPYKQANPVRGALHLQRKRISLPAIFQESLRQMLTQKDLYKGSYLDIPCRLQVRELLQRTHVYWQC